MYYHFNATIGRTETVKVGGSNVTPTYIKFVRDDESSFEVCAETFQLLRRAVHSDHKLESGLGECGDESKIRLIKAFRGLTGHDLRDAKAVVDYFTQNFDFNCGKRW